MHETEDFAPFVLLLLPGGHALQLLAATAPVALENVPRRHGVHVALLAAPMAVLHRPVGHGIHAVCSSFANVPDAHAVQ